MNLVTGSAQVGNQGFSCQLQGNQCEIYSLKPCGLCSCNGLFPLCWVLRCKTTKTNLDKKELCSGCDKRIQKPGLGRQEQNQKKAGAGGISCFTHTKQNTTLTAQPTKPYVLPQSRKFFFLLFEQQEEAPYMEGWQTTTLSKDTAVNRMTPVHFSSSGVFKDFIGIIG